MSTWHPIWSTIKALESAGRLYVVRPRSPREAILRPMYMVPALHAALSAGFLDPREKDRYNSLQADLEIFVTGAPVTNSYLKSLRPSHKAVWEIRSKRPAPSIRVLGMFASRDVFIATNYQLRSVLGKFDSIQWKEASRLARHEFRTLLQDEPLVGELHELVSGVIYV